MYRHRRWSMLSLTLLRRRKPRYEIDTLVNVKAEALLFFHCDAQKLMHTLAEVEAEPIAVALADTLAQVDA